MEGMCDVCNCTVACSHMLSVDPGHSCVHMRGWKQPVRLGRHCKRRLQHWKDNATWLRDQSSTSYLTDLWLFTDLAVCCMRNHELPSVLLSSPASSLKAQTLRRAEKHWRISSVFVSSLLLLLVVFRCFTCLPSCSLAFSDVLCAAAPDGMSATFEVQKESFNDHHHCRLLKSTDYPTACACVCRLL